MSAPSVDEAQAALGRFTAPGTLASLEPYTAGHINYSWLARFEWEGSERRYLLQQINRHVFRRPEHVLLNMQRVTGHIRARLAREGIKDPQRRVPSLCPTREGAASHLDERGETWRLLPWIEGTRWAERAASAADAFATARAFGLFLRRLTDLPAPALHTTIPAFHDTEARVRALEGVSAADPKGRAASCRAEIEALFERRLRGVFFRSVRSTTTPRSRTCSSTPRAARRSPSSTSTPRCPGSPCTTSAISCARA
jgi:hypothetical protein